MATEGIVNRSDLTTRQLELVSSISKRLNLSVDSVSSVILKNNIPDFIRYDTATSSSTRYVAPELGGLLTATELFDQEQTRISDAQQTAGDKTSAIIGSKKNPKLSGQVSSLARTQVAPASTGNPANASSTRTTTAGLTKGAVASSNQGALPLVTFNSATGEDKRVRITDPSGIFVNSANPLLKELVISNGVLFPYTPTIDVNHTANYTSESLTHSNYHYHFYQNSSVEDITIRATFVAKNENFARYILAVQHFFRSVTKMFYGRDAIAGTPPPVLKLLGYGDYQFGNTGGGVPIVISSFSSSYPNDVDYISTSINGSSTMVPVMQEMSITCKPIYSRNSITREFGLTDFAAGKLLTKGFI